jgi:hypothetical protein
MVNSGGYVVFDNYSMVSWPEVRKCVDELDFKKYGYTALGFYGESYIVKKY